MGLAKVFLIRGFLVGERKNCKCTLPSFFFFLLPLFQQGDSEFKSVYFPCNFTALHLSVGSGETSVVPPTHQARGLPNRILSLGGDGENQKFSKFDGVGDFHSEKTKLMKETDFSTNPYFKLQQFQYHAGFFLSCLRVPRNLFLSERFSIALSTLNIYCFESFRKRCVMNSGVNRKGVSYKRLLIWLISFKTVTQLLKRI